MLKQFEGLAWSGQRERFALLYCRETRRKAYLPRMIQLVDAAISAFTSFCARSAACHSRCLSISCTTGNWDQRPMSGSLLQGLCADLDLHSPARFQMLQVWMASLLGAEQACFAASSPLRRPRGCLSPGQNGPDPA